MQRRPVARQISQLEDHFGALAAIRMAFRPANIARSFDIGQLAFFFGLRRKSEGRLSSRASLVCYLVEIRLLSWRDNPALLCMTFAFFEEIDGSSGRARCLGACGGDGLILGRGP